MHPFTLGQGFHARFPQGTSSSVIERQCPGSRFLSKHTPLSDALQTVMGASAPPTPIRDFPGAKSAIGPIEREEGDTYNKGVVMGGMGHSVLIRRARASRSVSVNGLTRVM
uniref:Uncharacterized protein n=1 Tax=uncultured Acidobacteriota bacterium TaxID=171953 RepID=H5SPP6_9BACT|nr:hypothetical protein HGMM_F54F02C15 [uncultured Acidobacteriota bacterium]